MQFCLGAYQHKYGKHESIGLSEERRKQRLIVDELDELDELDEQYKLAELDEVGDLG